MKKHILAFITLLIPIIVFGMDERRDTVVRGKLEFMLNTDTIIENGHYTHFVQSVVPLIKENGNLIDGISITGSYSPEGGIERNRYLANIRAAKLLSFIDGYVDDSKIRVGISDRIPSGAEKYDEKKYQSYRCAYIEVLLNKKQSDSRPLIVKTDTVYVERIDTVLLRDTVYFEKPLTTIPIVGIKTNVLSDIIAAPNVQAEIYTHLAGISFEFSYSFPWWSIDEDKYFYYQVLNGTVGVRKYFKNDYTGHYAGAYGGTAIYDICFFNKDNGWQGEAYCVGLSYGYVFQSKKWPRLKFEPYIRAGWINTKYDTYHASQPFDEKYYYNWNLRADEFVPRRFVANYIGPTAIGFNLTFDLVCLRKYQ